MVSPLLCCREEADDVRVGKPQVALREHGEQEQRGPRSAFHRSGDAGRQRGGNGHDEGCEGYGKHDNNALRGSLSGARLLT